MNCNNVQIIFAQFFSKFLIFVNYFVQDFAGIKFPTIYFTDSLLEFQSLQNMRIGNLKFKQNIAERGGNNI